jgi:hypothetical protein
VAYQILATKINNIDLISANDVNQLQTNFEAIIGGDIPLTTINDLYNMDNTITSNLNTETNNRIIADNNIISDLNDLSASLSTRVPESGAADQIFKNNGSGVGAWGTVKENAGALTNVTVQQK